MCWYRHVDFLSQVSVNMLVCTGVFPVTGQNMPLLAMGGSALIMVSVSIGLVNQLDGQIKINRKILINFKTNHGN